MAYKRTISRFILPVLACLSLTACGGGSSSENNDDSGTPPPPPAATFSLSGNLSGLNGDGELEVTANNESKILTTDGEFTFDSEFEEGDEVEVSITSQPATSQCVITSDESFTFSDSDIDRLTIECSVETYSISGSASGMAREIQVPYTVNGSSDTIVLSDGDFVLSDSAIAGDVITFETISSIGHDCSVSPQSITVSADVTDIAVTCETFGSVSVTVSDYQQTVPLDGADVQVYLDEEQLLTSETTDANGRVVINAVGYQPRLVLRSSKEGYATRSDITRTTEERPDSSVSVGMLSVDRQTSFAAAEGGVVSDDSTGMAVELPADGFVNADGDAVTGNITGSLTNVDASSNPEVMPGDYIAYNPEDGSTMYMESFGAISAEFVNDSGEKVNLAEGKNAVINIPLASRAINPPATIPLVHFNEQSGQWVVEGEATLETNADGQHVYQGTVGHFSTWNADYLYESISLSGCVVNSETEQRLSGVRVTAEGADYIGMSSTYADESGNFTIDVRPNSDVFLAVVDPSGLSNTIRLATGSSDSTLEQCIGAVEGSMRVTLTWGDNPHDLDTHFMGPTVANGTQSDERFRIFYGDKQETVAGVTMFLDVDDVTSFGPEVLTVPEFPLPGVYRYGVHHFAGVGNIYQSPTRVEVQLDGETYLFSPSEDVDTTNNFSDIWIAFDVVVDDSGNATIEVVNDYFNIGNNDDDVGQSQSPQAPLNMPTKKQLKH